MTAVGDVQRAPAVQLAPARSRPRWLIAVATVLGVAITASLGRWQLDRAAQKEVMQAKLESRAELPVLGLRDLALSESDAQQQHYRRVRLQGRWLAGRTVFLDNRQMDGRVGFYVVTPLLLSTGDAVLVQRGWVPRDAADRTRLPAVPAQEGMVTVEGRVAPPPARTYALGAIDEGVIRQNLNVSSFAVESGVSLRPLSVQQTGMQTAADTLRRTWPAPALDVHKHYGYAAQWFGLALLIGGLFLWFQVRSPRRPVQETTGAPGPEQPAP